jgi:WD40 repeat protein
MSANVLWTVVGFLALGADEPLKLKEIAAWQGTGSATGILQFTPDGKTLATAAVGEKTAAVGEKAEVVLWEARTGRKVSTVAWRTRRVSALAFSSDGKSVAVGDDDGTIKVWEVGTEKERATFARLLNESVLTLAFAADSRTLLVAGRTTVLLKALEDGGKNASFERRVPVWHGGVFSPDAKTLASPNYEDLDLWDVNSGKIRRILADHHGGVDRVAFSGDGKRVALAVGRNEGYAKYDWEIKVYDGETGKERVTIPGDPGVVRRMALDDKAQTLLVMHLGLVNRRFDTQDELRIYDLANGGERCARKKLTAWIALSPDGKLLATLEGDNQIKVWELPLATNEKKP